jgi:hypothetical protein
MLSWNTLNLNFIITFYQQEALFAAVVLWSLQLLKLTGGHVHRQTWPQVCLEKVFLAKGLLWTKKRDQKGSSVNGEPFSVNGLKVHTENSHIVRLPMPNYDA